MIVYDGQLCLIMFKHVQERLITVLPLVHEYFLMMGLMIVNNLMSGNDGFNDGQ